MLKLSMLCLHYKNILTSQLIGNVYVTGPEIQAKIENLEIRIGAAASVTVLAVLVVVIIAATMKNKLMG